MVELIQKTNVSGNAIDYLNILNSRFSGEISRGIIDHDYLTNPEVGSQLERGKLECIKLGLICRSDNGSDLSCIKYKISELGYKVISLSKKQIDMAKLEVRKSYHYKGQELEEFGMVGNVKIMRTKDKKTMVMFVESEEQFFFSVRSDSPIEDFLEKPF